MKNLLSTILITVLTLGECCSGQPALPALPEPGTSTLGDVDHSLAPALFGEDAGVSSPPLSPQPIVLIWSNPAATSSWPVNNGFFLNSIQETQDCVTWSNVSPYFLACRQQCLFALMRSNIFNAYRLVTAYGASPSDTYALPTYLCPGLDNPSTPCCARDWLLATNAVKLVLQ